MNLDKNTIDLVLKAQRNEITEYYLYQKLADTTDNASNKRILESISKDELRHYNFWKKYTGEEVKPSKLKIWWYYYISKIAGLDFGIKFMERGEELSQKNYRMLSATIPKAREIEKEESIHEKKITNLVQDERVEYAGSMVLGINDALVELTGAIAGLTFAFQNTRLVGAAALITGMAAALSMAASEYLATKTEGGPRKPGTASVYTGIAYILVVVLLTLPYFLLSNIFIALAFTLVSAIAVIFIFTFYISFIKGASFRRKFFEMALISMGVAAFSFLVGMLIRKLLGIEV